MISEIERLENEIKEMEKLKIKVTEYIKALNY